EYYAGSITYNVGQKEDIGLLAHLDVVPAGDGWTVTEPYNPVYKDGFIFGRGCSDNKSGAIGSFYIMKALQANNVKTNHNIKLLLGCNEEVGMADMEYFVRHYPTPKFTIVPDAGFPGCCGEFGRIRYTLTSDNTLSDDFVSLNAGSAFNIIPNKATAVVKKGVFNLDLLPNDIETEETHEGVKLTASGMQCHAAYPEGGKNAIKVLTSALLHLNLSENDRKILTFIDNVNRDYYGTFLHIDRTDDVSGQTISSGTVLRFDKGHVSLLNDCRYCVTDNGDRLEEVIRGICAENGYSVKVNEKTYGSYIDKNGKEISTIRDVYQKETGDTESVIGIMKGGTYAGCIPNAMATGICLRQTPLPEYIPAGHGSVHGPDECLCVKDFIAGIKLLMTMLLELDATI
ncbi:MAG: Sapep family Mn(2+)-dependent dipeptidase, partial [Erysipelotrichaceae bacterium]|nr:Sapep family Mn(2+)-dependent dipeptidase [Erysipelotrichaceae bacterium]